MGARKGAKGSRKGSVRAVLGNHNFDTFEITPYLKFYIALVSKFFQLREDLLICVLLGCSGTIWYSAVCQIGPMMFMGLTLSHENSQSLLLANAGEGSKYMNIMSSVRLNKASIAKCHTADQSKPTKL